MIKAFFKETAIYSISSILVSLITFASLPIYTRVLSQDEYGIVALANLITSFLSIVFSFSLSTGYTRFFNTLEDSTSILELTILKFYAYSSTTFFSLFFVVSLIFREHWNKALGPETNSDILFLFFTLIIALITPVITLLKSTARMRHEPFIFFKISISLSLLSALIPALFVLSVHSVSSYLFGLAISQLLTLLVAFKSLEIRFKLLISSKLTLIKPLLKFSLPLLPAAFASYANSSLDQWGLAYFISNGAVAIYSIGLKCSSVILIINSVITNTFLPYSMKILEIELPEANQLLDKALRYFSVFASIAILSLQLISKPAFSYIFPPEYNESAQIIGFLALSSTLFSYTYFSTLGSWKASKSTDYSIAVLLGVFFNLLLNILLIPSYGIVGAAIATFFGSLSSLSLSFLLSHFRFAYKFSYIKLIITNLVVLISCIASLYISSNYSYPLLILLQAVAGCIIIFVNLSVREILIPYKLFKSRFA